MKSALEPAPATPARHLLIFTFLIGLITLSPGTFAADVRLAVAANFTDTTRELITAFTKASGLEASASFGSTGKLYAQIENGAPFDVFMAADSRRPELLESSGLGVTGTRFTYAQGKLVLWSPKSDFFTDGKEWLAQGHFSHLAIANPKTAPYGLAAEQFLTKAGLWDSLQPKLVRGDSISQTFQFAVSGNADAGFVALSQTRVWTQEGGTLWPVPQEDYEPINQQAILLTRSKENDGARRWLEFLRSAQGQAIIEKYGYGFPD